MKKLFALLFAAGLTLSLAMPVFARGAGSQDTTSTEKKTKEKKTKKAKKTKKDTSDTSKMSQ